MCTVIESPEARSPMAHVRTPDEMPQPVPCSAGSIVHAMPGPVGNVSLMVTPVAVPGPPLATTIVKPIVSPALTGFGSAVLVTVTDGHCTVVDADLVCVGALLDVSVAVLVYVAQLANTVALTTCAVTLPPGARSTAVQVRVCSAGAVPVTEQFAEPLASDQSSPVPSGSGSLMTTAFAVPVPGALLLDTVTVKPICEPALTGFGSAVLVNVSAGQSTTTLA